MSQATSIYTDKLETLRERASDEFSHRVLEGAQRALMDGGNPLRLNFFSTAMRILFEHVMDAMSPNEMVVKCSWFKPERDDNRPTRWQRIVFAIQGGLSDAFVTQTLSVDPSPLRKRLLKTVDELSKHVHGRESTIVLDPLEQDSQTQSTIEAMISFLDVVHDCRAAILEPIGGAIDDAAVETLLCETMSGLDSLATHHSIQGVYVDHLIVDAIGPHFVTYRATGSVSVMLQWGSNSDLRRDYGAELERSFPFKCDITTSVEDPWELHLSETEYSVDTSDWTEAMERDMWDASVQSV